MKKFLNEPGSFEREMLEGLVLAYPDQLRSPRPDLRALVRATPPARPGKVGLATGGGSGHLPLFLGYVGQGLLDGCAVGDIFQSPSAQVMLDVTRAINAGHGVLYIYGNYGGDILNFDMAAELAAAEGIRVETVIGTDDVASAPKGDEGRRRGVAGLYYVYKLAAATADRGADLDAVKAAAEDANAHTRTMGVAFTPTYLPATGKPTFQIAEDEMEIGMGIHGEPGFQRTKLATAREIVDAMLSRVVPDLGVGAGAEVSVLVNGLGGTSLEELHLVFREVHQWLAARDIRIAHPSIGNFATSMEMAGLSISLLELNDERKALLAAHCNTPFVKQC